MKNVLLLGGGTAGHITPNLALVPYLTNCQVHYAGGAGSMEEKLVTEAGIPFHPVDCAKFSRSFTLKNAAIPFKLARGISQSKKLLNRLNPAVIFSKGGFASLPALLAAGKKYPILLHESDFSLGLASRLCVKNAKYLCTSFEPLSHKYENAIFTGTPIRKELYFGDKQRALNECALYDKKPYLLIFGGSQGAAALSSAVIAAIDSLCAYFNVIHVVGKFGSRAEKHSGYFALEYCNNMADYYALADYCLCRAGANSLAEVVALKIPSLTVPLPKGNSRGDQQQNAEYYGSRGLVRVLSQDNLTPGSLVSELTALIRESQNMKNAMAKAPSPDGTRRIAALINNLLT